MPPKGHKKQGSFSAGASTNTASIEYGVLVRQLSTDLERGLSTDEATKRLAQFGRNELPEVPPTPWWKLVLEQFDDNLVKILLVAAAISFVMAVMEGNPHGYIEPAVILLILILNAVVGVWQESRAESAIEALKSFVPKTANVVRDGKLVSIGAELLVPGDVVEVAVGSRVPADMRVCALLSTTLRVDQAILTGESMEIMKHADVVARDERFPQNMLFSGTALTYGKARCAVVKTGASTEIGAIEQNVREQEEQVTPLQQKLDEFGVLLTRWIGYICIAVFSINIIRWFVLQRGEHGTTHGVYDTYVEPVTHCLKVAVALAVAAIPEGLPAVVTTCLALGTRKMAAHNALVRNLPSVETLGRCTVICSDKTGTLTTNMMSVAEMMTMCKDGSLRKYTVTDSKFNIAPHSIHEYGKVVANALAHDNALAQVAAVCALCNDSTLHVSSRTGQVERIGEATEAALLTLVEKLGSRPDPANIHAEYKRIAGQWTKNTTLEFTRERKSMGVHCTAADGRSHQLFVKGAPEAVLGRCKKLLTSEGQEVDLTASRSEAILREVRSMSGNEMALRCIGMAYKSVPKQGDLDLSNPKTFAQVESGMTFCGVVGMIDPPRAEVRDAVEKCGTAGIRVIVITGDNKATAEAICRKIGVLGDDGAASTEGLSFTGEEFDKMDLNNRRKIIRTARLFSRTDPSHKMALVQLLQEQKLICAMTGDGVNDAPALKRADIGIAMGTGTEVAKAASKMVLADDNFATVVKAVREGRAIYNNTKQFIRYLISSNIGEVVCILATGLCGIPDALAPVQLLWVNLVTDGLPATALGFNPPDPDIMEQPPRDTDEPIVDGWMFFRYMVVGAYVGVATVGGFLWWFFANGFTMADLTSAHMCAGDLSDRCAVLNNPIVARGIALSILVVVEMFNALNSLSENQSLIAIRPMANPWLLLAITSSMVLHFMIMYVPALAEIFSIAPLGVAPEVLATAAPWSIVVPTSFMEWKVILAFSIPVIFVDEVLKFFARWTRASRKAKRD